MKKISFLIPHYRSWKWVAICLWNLKKYGIPIEQEIIVVDNSPGHPSIKGITETELGEGVKVISGEADFPSHGRGYDLAYQHADGDWIFTCETDSFPFRHGWFDPYIKESPHYDLMGPEIPQSSGRYIHPAGAMIRQEWVERALEWQRGVSDWVFCPGAAVEFCMSDKPYHVVAHKDWLAGTLISTETERQMEVWSRPGVWQEMRAFENDNWDTYPQRTCITNFDPPQNKNTTFTKIGYEAGQWLAYFVEAHGGRVLRAPTEITWIDRHEGKQAKKSDVFGGFRHIWAGTSTVVSDNFPKAVLRTKKNQLETWYSGAAGLPLQLRMKIEKLENENSTPAV